MLTSDLATAYGSPTADQTHRAALSLVRFLNLQAASADLHDQATTYRSMASTEQTTKPTATAGTQRDSSSAIVKSLKSAILADQPDVAAVVFTQQDAPLLRTPGELRNRIYHEVFQTTFSELEANKEAHEQRDPEVLHSLLVRLTACRQIHHEAMSIFFRHYVAQKPYWNLRAQDSMPRFFTRTTSFCQALERYASNSAHLTASHMSHGLTSGLITPAKVKGFLEELACQVQQDVCISFETLPRFAGEELRHTRSSDAAAWNDHWARAGLCF